MLRIAKLGLVLAMLSFVVSCTAQDKNKSGDRTPTQAAPAVRGGSGAPAFVLKDSDGKSVSLADYKGKVVILDFWATWCPPCRREIPHFVELQKEYGSKGLQVIGVAVDQDGWDKVKPFMQSNGINYPVLMYTESVYDAYQQLLPEAERGGIPFTFVIDKNGQVKAKYVGYREKAVFEAAIKPLL
jgi:cytochrome c biogenesis protein CcmG/thiol:disulfide interchange protein DsbE